MNKIEPIFKWIKSNDDDDGDVFEAVIELPTDSTPGSDQKLVLRVTTHYDKRSEFYASVKTIGGKYEFVITDTVVHCEDALTRLLYSVAREKTIKILQPICLA